MTCEGNKMAKHRGETYSENTRETGENHPPAGKHSAKEGTPTGNPRQDAGRHRESGDRQGRHHQGK